MPVDLITNSELKDKSSHLFYALFDFLCESRPTDTKSINTIFDAIYLRDNPIIFKEVLLDVIRCTIECESFFSTYLNLNHNYIIDNIPSGEFYIHYDSINGEPDDDLESIYHKLIRNQSCNPESGLNVDTAFLIFSCNKDRFDINALEQITSFLQLGLSPDEVMNGMIEDIEMNMRADKVRSRRTSAYAGLCIDNALRDCLRVSYMGFSEAPDRVN